MFVVALVMTPAMILLTMYIASLGGWWQLLAAVTGFCALAFLYMGYLILFSSPRETKMERERNKNAYSWLSSSVVWLGDHG